MTRSMDPELLDAELELSLREMCRICGVHAEFLVDLVNEGVIEARPPGRRRSRRPTAAPLQQWRFDGVAVVRVQRAVRLQRDLGVNLPGVALALELLDELERLRAGNR